MPFRPGPFHHEQMTALAEPNDKPAITVCPRLSSAATRLYPDL
jgi:hypothetical protein